MPLDLFDEAQNKVLESKGYADFKRELVASDCQRCPLSNSRTHIVVDRGNPRAKVLIIGEAPGQNEDLQAKAFVGRAGQLLDRLMKEIGFDTNEDSLIVNVVKCRPPDNRTPTAQEATTCITYLKKQITLVSPRFILLLGATALKHLFIERKDQAMKGQVGQFFTRTEYPNIEFMVLYHPAYILRDPRKRPEIEQHLRVFKERWRGLNIA